MTLSLYGAMISTRQHIKHTRLFIFSHGDILISKALLSPGLIASNNIFKKEHPNYDHY
jgi:hypothetical protein